MHILSSSWCAGATHQEEKFTAAIICGVQVLLKSPNRCCASYNEEVTRCEQRGKGWRASTLSVGKRQPGRALEREVMSCWAAMVGNSRELAMPGDHEGMELGSWKKRQGREKASEEGSRPGEENRGALLRDGWQRRSQGSCAMGRGSGWRRWSPRARRSPWLGCGAEGVW
jgi:hypothetical protein